MMIADLQVHSVFSSYALYLDKPKVMEKLRRKYEESEFLSVKDLWWAEKILIDGISTPEQILRKAKDRGLGAIAITDHNTTIGNYEAQFLSTKYDILVVPAMELSTLDGEILAYGIKNKIPIGLTAETAIKAIHEQGGVAVAAHPFNPKHMNKDFSRIDEEKIRKLRLDGVEVASSMLGYQRKWKDIADELNMAITGGSDAHTPALIGTVWTTFDDECNTVEKIVKAIKQRRTDVGCTVNRFPLIARTVTEYMWGNTFGRPFIKVI